MRPANCSGSYSEPPRARAIALRSSSCPREVDATTFSIRNLAMGTPLRRRSRTGAVRGHLDAGGALYGSVRPGPFRKARSAERFHPPPEPRLLWTPPIPWLPEGECHEKPREADTGRIPHRHTGPDGQRRREADRFPKAGVRRQGKGTVHESGEEDPPRRGHPRGLDRAVERRDGGVEAGPGPVAPVRDGHGRDVPTGPQGGCDVATGTHGRILRGPERRREGPVRQFLVDRHPSGRRVPRGTREARGGPAEEVARATRRMGSPRNPSPKTGDTQASCPRIVAAPRHSHATRIPFSSR